MTHSRSETGFRLAHVELADFESASEICGSLQKFEGLEVGSSVSVILNYPQRSVSTETKEVTK